MGTRIVIGFVLFAILGYGLMEAIPLLRGPQITFSSPTEYSTSTDGFVTLSGIAKNTETLTLNGHILLIDESGHFNTQLLFPTGGSVLVLNATDRFGRNITEKRTIYAL